MRGQVSLEFLLLAAGLVAMLALALPAYNGLLGAQSSLAKTQQAKLLSNQLKEAIHLVSFSPAGTSHYISMDLSPETIIDASSHSLKVSIPLSNNTEKSFEIHSFLVLEDHRADANASFYLTRYAHAIWLES